MLREAWPLLAEQEYAGARQHRRLERHRAGQVVHTDDRQSAGMGPPRQILDRCVMAYMLVAVGHHCPAAVPPAATDDVHFPGEERVGGPDHRTDVEVMLPVLD